MKRLPALVLLIVAIVAATVYYLRTRDLGTDESLLAHLPSEDGTVVSIDFAALRRGGILDLLSGPVVEEEPEYKTFVAKTGFDYRRDVDSAFLSFAPGGVYFLVRGRFDWKRLEAYAREQGGGCSNGLCRMPGSLPERKISFFSLRPNLLGMAVSVDDSAAAQLSEKPKRGRAIRTMKQPVWLSMPSATLKRSSDFPVGTQLFAKAMQDAESATLSFGPTGKAIEAQLEVLCKDAGEATVLTAQFQRMTTVLGQIIAKEKQKPNPGELAAVLISGVFEQQNTRVVGRWPIERAFLDKLSGKK